MIPLARVERLVEADRAAQAAGTPVATLMGRAGAALAAAARELLGGTAGRQVVALAGRGHNGGDALEALARLARRGAGVEALVTGELDRLDAEGRRCVALVRAAGGRVRVFTPERAHRLLGAGAADLVVDGLLGTGSSGAPRGAVGEAIAATGGTAAPVLAVDIPSGVDGSTGEVPGPAVHAAVTVTFQAVKPGHVLAPGSLHAGRLLVADIGLPLQTGWEVSEAAGLAPLVPVPRGELHKRSRGVLLVVAGASGMAGAATLAGRAARRAGVGLLVLAAPASAGARVGAAVPEALTVALPERDGAVAEGAAGALERWLGEADALAVGPGLGRADFTGRAVLEVLGAEVPAVVDADGLFALGTGEPLAGRRAPTVLTPHAGEFARLAPGARGTRLDLAAGRARQWRATVLLKGNDTVIAEPGGRLAVNPTGTAVLATGGTGDVLTGVVGALLAQGLEPFDAARLAAFVHGRAGALASRALAPVSVAAGDVADHLPAAWRELLDGASPGRVGRVAAWRPR
ncbi:MAG TPA: NAD(P)H-hydrate dehydratase [Actinomycetes bacterium]|nr:NAD(P)H-hydrate dehydratase [Actinomycetes bacterium]